MVKQVLDRLIHVGREELEATHIVHARPLTETLKVLELEGVRVRRLNIPPRRLHEQEPLRQLAAPLGLEVQAVFYDAGGIPLYYVEEPRVTPFVKKVYAYLKSRLGELGVTSYGEVVRAARDVFEDLGVNPTLAFAEPEVKAALYYVARDLLGYGPLDPFMLDPYVEEVSWFTHDGPVEVVDKKVTDVYPNAEFIPTNMYIDPTLPEHIKTFIMVQVIRPIVSRAKTGLTVARPIAEGRIPDPSGRGFHRLAAHLDIVSRSPAVTIRKFPHVKYSLARLVAWGTLSPLEAAYLLVQLLARGFILIVGDMGSGKTTLLQALISALPSTYKVLTIEDTPELSTPAFNWHPLYVRRAPPGSEMEDVDFPKLVRHSLRHRAFIVTLGEVRGEEFNMLVQAAASGHGAICTFHAEDPFTVLMRITSPPINVSPASLLLISSIVHISKAKTWAGGRPKRVRRVLRIFEILGVKGESVDWVTTFRWDPARDRHSPGVDPDGLAELWLRSRFLRTVGSSVYGEDDAMRILADVYVIAKFIDELARRGVYDIKQVHVAFTKLYVKLDSYTEQVWPKLEPRLRNAIRRLESRATGVRPVEAVA